MMRIAYLLLLIATLKVAEITTQAGLGQSKNTTISPNASEAEKNELGSNYPNVLSVKFHMRRQKIPELLTKITLLEMKCPIKSCNISAIDIVKAIELDKYSSAEIANGLEKLNVTLRDVYNMFLVYHLNTTSIENILTTAGTSFSEIYKNFVDSLADPVNTVPQILNIFNVSVLDFMSAQAYGNDTTKLKVLATGNCSFENIQTMLNITNKTGTELLKALPLNTIARNLENFEPGAFRDFVKNFGINSTSLASFYNYMNVSLMHFITYPAYVQILSDFESYLNPEEVVGTIIGQTSLITSNKATSLIKYETENTKFVRNYSYFQAENIENSLTHYHIKNVVLKNDEYRAADIAVVELQNVYRENIMGLTTTINSTKLANCTYVTKLPFGEMFVEKAEAVVSSNGYELVMLKSNGTIYNLGSPLFCQNKLVAMATKENANDILFSTFIKKSSEVPKPPIQHTTTPSPRNVTVSGNATTSKHNAGIRNYADLLFIILVIGLTSYM